MIKQIITLVLLLSLFLALGCSEQQDAGMGSDKSTAAAAKAVPPRWYSAEQVARGAVLYQANCAACHKPDATGTDNWKELDAQGKLPPPPLNGTAHTWHHPLSVLRRTVRIGGVPLGGTMPPFADKLDAQQIDDILAWVQTHWSDEIYTIWHERNTQASQGMQRINKS